MIRFRLLTQPTRGGGGGGILHPPDPLQDIFGPERRERGA